MAMSRCCLTVEITGLRNCVGDVCVALFADRSGFPKAIDRAFAKRRVSIEATELSVEFADLPYGSYGISAFHDENQDGKLNTFLGVPREGVGFSNNPTLRPGISFEVARFEVVESAAIVRVQVKYLPLPV
jgi:uncharacterized protein (DUF2141 family)